MLSYIYVEAYSYLMYSCCILLCLLLHGLSMLTKDDEQWLLDVILSNSRIISITIIIFQNPVAMHNI